MADHEAPETAEDETADLPAHRMSCGVCGSMFGDDDLGTVLSAYVSHTDTHTPGAYGIPERVPAS